MARLLVVGGSGFIGRAICRQAVAAGHEVRSVSRSGRPEIASGRWVEAVEWTSADLFSPHAWRDRLRGVDAVIHSVGIAHEKPKQGATYERCNGDSAIITALEAERAGVETYVFLSSAANYPTARRAYLRSKRRAERAVEDLNMETVVLRPGAVYGPGQPHFPEPFNWLCRLVAEIEPLAERLGDRRPLSVDRVADVALESAVDPDTRLLTVEDIARK
ncbi:NADH dehydrogenase [Halohasta litchfieldiae]|jgi:NADH dehydrogenase|uniref:NADH dehydrogenase n=1 Tax=Halohasta litchfieldiae TaxID=1073996 RepID=A0A1H6S8M6_9EURY|nr:NAD-dependent epimerase/dehydratase family protein [Halohasta litchfieldiae]ATW87873.1 NADH dehydrogenase [Halohasta litchfieldiae]SEI63146.1 NADH dehydrogenase [Halohasta litchfieldiae]